MDTGSIITSKSGAQKIGKQPPPGMQMPKDASINDRDRLNAILMHQKQIIQGYTTGLNELFNSSLYHLTEKNRGRVQELHTQTVKALFDMGEYTADLAPKEQVTDAYDTFCGYKSQLPYGTPKPH